MATRKTPTRKAASEPAPEEAALAKAESAEASNPQAVTGETQDIADTATAEGLMVKGEAKGDTKPRFHFFLIDAGWKSKAAKVIRENFHMIRDFQNDDPLYVLSREQSVHLIRSNPDLIGKDPIILVHDLHAKGGRGESGYHGFRLCMGLLKDEKQALKAMQEFLRFVHNHRHSPDIEKAIRERLHRQGLEGAIEIIREGASELTA